MFFNDFNEAKRYRQNRPYFHQLAINRAAKTLGINEIVPIALDIACGTGQSSVALSSIAEQVIGLDLSWSMLTNAEFSKQVHYTLGRAEVLPLVSSSIPVASCALAFHWFNRDLFLKESWRVLKPGGFLIIYNNGFTGTMREMPAFEFWAQNIYPERYPTPPRNSKPLTNDEMVGAGFALIGEEKYQNELIFTPDELSGYLITQTNVVAALQQAGETVEAAREWLLAQITPYFPKEKATFVFSTRAWYLIKTAPGIFS